jgi:SH3-like domain-containing protein
MMENRFLTALGVVFFLGLAGGAGAADQLAPPPEAALATAKNAPPMPVPETPPPPLAKEESSGPQLPIPRFVTLNADEVNLRTGPGLRYPITLILKKDGLPVQIIKEFDVWRQIADRDGDQGWVHKSLLSGKRAVIISGPTQTLFKKADEGSRPIVKLETGVIAGLDRCNNDWCYLKVAGYKGWLKRENIWGVYPDEKFAK